MSEDGLLQCILNELLRIIATDNTTRTDSDTSTDIEHKHDTITHSNSDKPKRKQKQNQNKNKAKAHIDTSTSTVQRDTAYLLLLLHGLSTLLQHVHSQNSIQVVTTILLPLMSAYYNHAHTVVESLLLQLCPKHSDIVPTLLINIILGIFKSYAPTLSTDNNKTHTSDNSSTDTITPSLRASIDLLSSAHLLTHILDTFSHTVTLTHSQLQPQSQSSTHTTHFDLHSQLFQLTLTLFHSCMHPVVRKCVNTVFIPFFIKQNAPLCDTLQRNKSKQHQSDTTSNNTAGVINTAAAISDVDQHRDSRLLDFFAGLLSDWQQYNKSSALNNSGAVPQSQQIVYDIYNHVCMFYPALIQLPSLYTRNHTDTTTSGIHTYSGSTLRWGTVDNIVLDMCRQGFTSALMVVKKQSAFLLKVRLAHVHSATMRQFLSRTNDTTSDSKDSVTNMDGYTADQWEHWQSVYVTLDGSGLHLVQSVWPRIQYLLPCTSMSQWLDILVRKAFGHGAFPVRTYTMLATMELFIQHVTIHGNTQAVASINQQFILGPMFEFLNTPLVCLHVRTAHQFVVLLLSHVCIYNKCAVFCVCVVCDSTTVAVLLPCLLMIPVLTVMALKVMKKELSIDSVWRNANNRHPKIITALTLYSLILRLITSLPLPPLLLLLPQYLLTLVSLALELKWSVSYQSTLPP